ncbi:substrate-binding domain-containing protein [Halalkalicoccus jeotgali]|uniref:ABC-type sugar transport system periplasmic component-like protein n=1 Tax=Halalkalicoccus jeotgali (strain DSM 18796 / CECT 7217 / JCM 14584 / KCTC 4019 / B3) TaxID=795797 RepID=D8JCP2_HALJB|nr:substrate-binding domain-containing protein [Halalkalicoccus jeotgali]ADJ17149.1 ABC-type sugar transport system periplasmic component-like protein [Halalkalicoccus jeotgali B3]ELY41696.1 ABC-type sugar transport system periplasmic component-like protein [Halalkalicoccus jeotgali B3]
MDIEDIEVNHPAGKGPNGADPLASEAVDLTDDQAEAVRNESFSVAIVFHHLKTAWTELQRRGLEERFDELGVTVDGVYGAEFNASKQTEIIEKLSDNEVDAVISIPVDTAATADAYRAVADAGIELVFMDNVPDGFEHPRDYAGCVSSDNEGVGIVAGRFLREFLGKGDVGMITFDAPFYVTDQRESGVRDVLRNSDDVTIAAEEGFTDPDDVYDLAQNMVVTNPNLNGMFVSWSDPPAVQATRAVEDVGRSEFVITTTGLSSRTVENIALGGPIKGTGAQFPYQQGIIEANMVGQALLGESTPPFIASGSLPVYRGNFKEQYPKHYQEGLPEDLLESSHSI